MGSLFPQGVTAIGRLFWRSDEELQQEAARFVCVRAPRTDADIMVKLLLSYWCINIPSVLISITGGADHNLNLEPRLEHLIKEGLNEAARSTHAWVFTGGTDTGVMSLAGAAFRARSTSTQTDAARWNTPLIGIAPLSNVINHQVLRDANPERGKPPLLPYVKNERNSEAYAGLDPNHTHFILVENEVKPGWGSEVEMRGQIETKLSEKHNLPIICLVISGGPNTLATLVQAIKHDCPVVLVRDSKGCALAVAELVQKLLRRGVAHEQAGGGNGGKVAASDTGGCGSSSATASGADDGVSPLTQAQCVSSLAVGMSSACLQQDLPNKELTQKIEELVALLVRRWRSSTLEQLVHVFSLQDQRMQSLQTSILNAVVSSCKLRSDRNARQRNSAKATHKVKSKVGALARPATPPVHQKARSNVRYSTSSIARQELRDDEVHWRVPLQSYCPPFHEDPILAQHRADLPHPSKQWADPPKEALNAKWQADIRARKTFERGGLVDFDDAAGLPRNPRGRTGLGGRGLLGKWGPNLAADAIVTRLHPQTHQLQMVAVERMDEPGMWSLPGGFFDAGETPIAAVKREFMEETGDFGEDTEGQEDFNQVPCRHRLARRAMPCPLARRTVPCPLALPWRVRGSCRRTATLYVSSSLSPNAISHPRVWR